MLDPLSRLVPVLVRRSDGNAVSAHDVLNTFGDDVRPTSLRVSYDEADELIPERHMEAPTAIPGVLATTVRVVAGF